MAKSSAKGHYQRLRERFLQDAAGSRTDESLLELLLTFSIGKRDVKEMAQTLLQQFGSLENLITASPNEILQVKGVGLTSLTLFKLIHFFQTHQPVQSASISERAEYPTKSKSTGALLDLIKKQEQSDHAIHETVTDYPEEKAERTDSEKQRFDSTSEAGSKQQKEAPAWPQEQKKTTKTQIKPQPFVEPGKTRKLQISNSYYLEFDQLARVFYFLREHRDSKTIKRKIMCEELGLAESQVKSLVSMGNAMGLIKPKSHALTALGAVIAENDIFFEQMGTLELCHHIAAGSSINLIWFELFNTLLPQEKALSLAEAAQILQTDLSGQYTEKTLKKHVRKELRFVANAYQEQNFRKLDLLKQTNDGKLYLRRYLQMHPFILAAALYDFGARIDSELLQISNVITMPGSPALVFGLDRASLVELVETLHEHELVRYETTHNLNQIRLKSYAALDFVRAYYQNMAPAQFFSRAFTGDDT